MNFDVTDLIEVSDEQETGSSLPRRVVSLLMLALAGYCFWQGSGLFVWEDSARTIAAVASQTESAVVPDALPITQIDVGDWVFAARNPSESDDEGSSLSADVDSSTWRLMVLKAYKPNGQPMEVRMLRPLAWLDQQNAQPGKNIYIASEELGFFGDMLVKEIHACPQLMPRPGPGYEVVTATFRHRRADVIDLSVQDVAQPIGTTGNHPFWSEDRQSFTPAGDLEIGEKLRLANGNLTYLTKTTPRPGTHWVYNLEVNTQHVYHVSDAGLLVHNSNACGFTGQGAFGRGRVTPRNTVLSRDLSGGPHAPDFPFSNLVSRAHGSGNAQGRWVSVGAAQRAANQIDMTKAVGKAQLVKINPGDAIVIHPIRRSYPPGKLDRKFLQVQADYAIGIPRRDGTVHIIPIDQTHNFHPLSK